MNINKIKEALPVLFKIGTSPLLVGQHGVGKTTLIRDFCRENDFQMVSFRLGQVADAGDLAGLPAQDLVNDVTRFLKPEWWPTSGRGVVFLDEINRTRRDLLQCVFELVEKGTMNGRSLPEGWHVVAAMNPETSDYQVTSMTDKAFYDRFCVLKVESSYVDFLAYGNKNNFSKAVLGFINAHPGVLRGNTEDFKLEYVTPSDRSWERVSHLENLKVELNIDEDMMNELVTGIVGTEAAISYKSYQAKAEKPVDAALILKSYPKVQKEIKAQYSPENYRGDLISATTDALLVLLKDRGDKELPTKELNNILAFICDMPPEVLIAFTEGLFATHHSKLFLQIGGNESIKEATDKAFAIQEEAQKKDEKKK